ncbi:MAG: TIGR02147 family protein [Proteobacteria bacterium]|nr:TIGR02147 family protein [Pseudomonadota bacterium]
MDVFSHRDYRDILQTELTRRIKQNPRYSQGAFARDLALSPSRLSEILHAKQGISTQVGQQIARQLRYNAEETTYFLDLIESQHGRSRLLREAARLRLLRYRRAPSAEMFSDEIFKMLADWYHSAILELFRFHNKPEDADWYAKQLGISPSEAAESIQKLEQFGLIQTDRNGRLELQEIQKHFVESVQSESFQKFCRQILWKALEAVEQARPLAMHSYMIAVAEKNLPQLFEIMRETCNKLAENLDIATEPHETVYCLAAQFFPVSGLMQSSKPSPLH